MSSQFLLFFSVWLFQEFSASALTFLEVDFTAPT